MYSNNNPAVQIIQRIKSGENPQQLMLAFLENNMQSTPIGANLLNLAKRGRSEEILQFVRNYYQQQGVDFDKEFNAFRNYWGL